MLQCRCLINIGSDTTQYARACTNNHNQLWKLNSDDTLRPKDDTSKCLFLIEPGNSDLSFRFKVLHCNFNYANKKFNFEYPTRKMPSEPMLHSFFKLRAKNDGLTKMVGKSRISAWPTDRLGVTPDRHFRAGIHDHSSVLVPVHKMCSSVSSFQPLSTDCVIFSQFQSKPKLCNGPCNRGNLNDKMRKKTRYNLLCGSESIFVTRKLRNSLIEIKIMRRWIACSFFRVAECK